MRTALRTSFFPALAVPVVITAAAGLFLACGSSNANRTFDDTTKDGGAGEGGEQGFGDKKDAGPPPSCATAEATAVKPPVDFIFVIDQSGSMDTETAQLQSNINGLGALLQKSGLDYRVVMIAGTSGFNAVCVPPPLGGPGCTSSAQLRVVNQHIESWDALKWTLQTLQATGGPTAWRDFIREDSLKVFIPITDDRAGDPCGTPAKTCTGAWFDASLLSIGGTAFGDNNKRKYVAYPIVGANAYPAETVCNTAVNNGPEYLELAKITGGKWYPVCSPNFGTLLTDIGQTVNAAVACELAIPSVEGQELDPNRVNVKIKKPDGSTVEVLQDTKDCNNGADGWQYSADGKKVILCGQVCESVKQNPDDKVTVEFGCQTKVK
jgi:hypothetical protein